MHPFVRRTDGRTDRQTDTFLVAIVHAGIRYSAEKFHCNRSKSDFDSKNVAEFVRA